MLLAVNIGNTRISCAVFGKDRIVRRFSLPSRDYSAAGIKRACQGLAGEKALICSVVPALSLKLSRQLKALGMKPYIIGKDIRVPMANLYRKPKRLGQDRLVNAYAAAVLYGAPLIVVDFGTAVTLDAVSAKKKYLGGMILPGLNMALGALAENTALLPKVKLNRPRELIGRDSASGMLSGAVYGLAALSDGLIEKIKRQAGRNARVIATGGDAPLVKSCCRRIDRVDPDLIFKGLNLIAKKAIKR